MLLGAILGFLPCQSRPESRKTTNLAKDITNAATKALLFGFWRAGRDSNSELLACCQAMPDLRDLPLQGLHLGLQALDPLAKA